MASEGRVLRYLLVLTPYVLVAHARLSQAECVGVVGGGREGVSGSGFVLKPTRFRSDSHPHMVGDSLPFPRGVPRHWQPIMREKRKNAEIRKCGSVRGFVFKPKGCRSDNHPHMVGEPTSGNSCL